MVLLSSVRHYFQVDANKLISVLKEIARQKALKKVDSKLVQEASVIMRRIESAIIDVPDRPLLDVAFVKSYQLSIFKETKELLDILKGDFWASFSRVSRVYNIH